MSRAYDAVFLAAELKPGDARENVTARAFWAKAERGTPAPPHAKEGTPYGVTEERVRTWLMPPVLMRVAALLCGVALFIWLEVAPWGSRSGRHGAPAAPPPPRRQLVDAAVELVWQRPPYAEKGLVLLAHGCNHQATDFWPSGPGGGRWLGLPEELRVVRLALARGYAVAAVTSADRLSGCWQSSVDGPRVVRALSWLRGSEAWATDLPLFALGASSGGRFVASLPKLLLLQAAAVQIMGLGDTDVRGPFFGGRTRFPPTLFVHMPRDVVTAAALARSVVLLRRSGTATLALEAMPVRVTPYFFSERIDSVSDAASRQAVDALHTAALLSNEGLLLEDPRSSEWREAIASLELAKGDSLAPDQSPVAEVLNVAWAQHELTAEWMTATLTWFDTRGQLEALDAAAKATPGEDNVGSPAWLAAALRNGSRAMYDDRFAVQQSTLPQPTTWPLRRQFFNRHSEAKSLSDQDKLAASTRGKRGRSTR